MKSFNLVSNIPQAIKRSESFKQRLPVLVSFLRVYPLLVLLFSILSSCIPSETIISPQRTPQPDQAIAFPEAEGFGAMSIGGRGGKVIAVTNLNDDGPGSLRHACYSKEPRIIVFQVAGIIELRSDIKLSEPFVTIAGQTAPGDGVCIKSATLRICTHDVIIRFMRFRVGDGLIGAEPFNRDALKIEGTNAYNVIVDHCSMSWAVDENLSTWGTPHNITIQWCIISEALNRSRHPKGAHSMGVIFGDRSNRISFHHNILAHNGWRNPLVQIRTANPAEYDIRNNLIYNFGKFCSVVRGNIQLNYIGNYIIPGHNSIADHEIHIDRDRNNNLHPKIFLEGNVALNHLDANRYNGEMVLDMTGIEDPDLMAKDPFPLPKVNTEPANEAYEAILELAGAIKPKRDDVDLRIILDVRNRTGKIIDSQQEVGGWPIYESESAPSDSDHDGMPDEWERAHGLNQNDPSDAAKTANGYGYTNIEYYLDYIAREKDREVSYVGERFFIGLQGDIHDANN